MYYLPQLKHTVSLPSAEVSNSKKMISAISNKSKGSRFFKRNLTCLAHVINFLIVATCSTLLLYESKVCLEKYLAKETRTVLNVRLTGEATFLAFTICPAYEVSYKQDTLSDFGTSMQQVRDGNFSLNAGLEWKRDGVFEKVTHDFNDIIDDVLIYTENRLKSRITLKTDKPIDPSQMRVVAKYWLTLGRCFSLELQPNITKLGITKVKFTGKMSLYIYLHYPHQFLDKDTKTKVHVDTGKANFLDLSYEITENTLAKESPIPCNPDEEYNYDTCTYKVVKDELEAQFRCFFPVVPLSQYGNGTICSNMSMDQIKELKDYFSYLSRTRSCMVPCKTMEVYLGMMQTSGLDNDKTEAILYIKSTVKYKKKIIDYTLLTMIAEIGGYEGLLLGIAIVSVTGWISKMSDRLDQMF